MRFASRCTFEIQSASVIECNARVGDNARLFKTSLSISFNFTCPFHRRTRRRSSSCTIQSVRHLLGSGSFCSPRGIDLNHTAYLRLASSFFSHFTRRFPFTRPCFSPASKVSPTTNFMKSSLNSISIFNCFEGYAHFLDMIIWPPSSNQSMMTSQNLGM